jgi:Protein kinase domain
MMMPGNAGGSLAEAGFAAGAQIAGYRLEEQVGAGGMAVVYRARDERLGRLVALKILAPALADDDAFRQRFIRESRAAAAVDDPHIVPVFAAGEVNAGQHGTVQHRAGEHRAGEHRAGEHRGVLFIAMRYVAGGDVRALMRREGRLSPARAAAIISPVASALDAAHGAGLVHRDVKPANILVDVQVGRPDHVYLADFGLSKAAFATSGLTGAGQFLGTADYISPEQIEDRPVDGRTDEYALACTAFELLAGAPPFRRDEAMAVMYAQLSEPPPLLTSRRPGLPQAADQVFARALAKAPEDRYGSCREFAEALRAAFGIAPHHSGPWLSPAAGQSPAQLGAWPAAAGLPAAEAAARPAVEADVPAARGHATGPGRSGPGARDGAQPARRRHRRRGALATLSGISVLVLAAVTAAVVLLTTPDHGSTGFSSRAKPHPGAAAPIAQLRITPTAAPPRPATPAGSRPVTPTATFPATSAPPPSPVPVSATPTPAQVTPTAAPANPATPAPAATQPATPAPAPGY